MSPRVGDDKVGEVRERANIAEVVGRYVALRRSGRNHMGRCPFHEEKTPSFSVSDERGFFHCFGCGASGDVFTFLMRIENLSFPEALERLARELGIELPKRPEQTRREESRERLFELNARAAEYFQRRLWNEKTGATAREYLKRRGLDEETARRFTIGYAPPEGLARALEAAKVPTALAESLGLIGRSRRGGWYDRFRDRLMFPISDVSGKVVGFGGRLLGESGQGNPKYLNSPESAVFHKGRALFGIGAAREAIRERDRAIVVEGYIDAIALSQAGIGNVVAPLGTALTADQIRLLRRFTDNISVFFDGDAAGAAAAARSFAVFAEVGLFADAAFLPEGHDPDTFVRETGREGVERLLATASPLVDHYLRTLARADAPLPARLRAGQSVAEVIARTGSPIFSGLLARRASELLGIAEEQLLKSARANTSGPPPRTPAPPPPDPKPPAEIGGEEALMVELVFVHPELASEIPRRIDRSLLSDPARGLLDRVQGMHIADLLKEIPAASAGRITKALDGNSEIYPEPARMLSDCLTRLEQERVETETRVLGQRIRDAETRGDAAELARLLQEKQLLAARKRPPSSGD